MGSFGKGVDGVFEKVSLKLSKVGESLMLRSSSFQNVGAK